MSDEIAAGLSFSPAYLRPAAPLRDDKRFRVRLHALFDLMITDPLIERAALVGPTEINDCLLH